MDAPREIFYTPQSVVQLAQGVPKHEAKDAPTDEILQFTRTDIIELLEEKFRDVIFKGKRLFYVQDHNIYWWNAGKNEPKAQVEAKAAEFVDPLQRVRLVVRDWLISKGADVLATEQKKDHLMADDNPLEAIRLETIRWAAIVGDSERAAKLSWYGRPLVVNELPIEHPNIMPERIELLQDGAFPDAYLTFAPNMSGVKNLDERAVQLSEKERIDFLVDGLKGLQEVHRRGFVYCDFKADQILTTKPGKLADLESLVPVGHRGEHVANDLINEDIWYHFVEECGGKFLFEVPPRNREPTDHLPIDTKRDVFSVAVVLLELLVRAKDPAFGIEDKVQTLIERNDMGGLYDLLEGKVTESCIDSMLHAALDAMPNTAMRIFRWYLKNEHLGRRFLHRITDAYRRAKTDEDRSNLKLKYSIELQQYVSPSLADVIIRGLSNVREERPELEEIIEALEKMSICQFS